MPARVGKRHAVSSAGNHVQARLVHRADADVADWKGTKANAVV